MQITLRIPPSEWDPRLPHRIFATNRYPDARLNVYSKPDILTVIYKVLKGTQEFDTILDSPLRSLFKLRVSECSISCKLVHALLCRQLVSKRKYELWTVFGGQPLRFSLMEFGAVTGLDCSEFPEDYDPDYQHFPAPGEQCYWDNLIGDDRKATLADVSKVFEDPKVDDLQKKLRLALLLIVDGVLIASSQTHRPTFKFVEMLADVDSFLTFPWGRESFLKTISAMMPGKKILTKPASKKLRKTFRLNGFPLSLQLLAYRNISGLLDKIPGSNDPRTFLEWDSVGIPKNSLQLTDVHQFERSPELTISNYIHVDPPEEGWGEFDDEVKDRKVSYLMSLIEERHVFKSSEWPGGDSSLPLIVIPEKPRDVIHRRHIVSRRRKTSQRFRSRQSTTSKHKDKPVTPMDNQSNIEDPLQNDLRYWFEAQLTSIRSSFDARLNKLESKNKKLIGKLNSMLSRGIWKPRHRRQLHIFKKPSPPPNKEGVCDNAHMSVPKTVNSELHETTLDTGSPEDILDGGHDWSKYSTNGDQDAKFLSQLPVHAEDIQQEDAQGAKALQVYAEDIHSVNIQEDDVQAHAIQAQDDHQHGDQAEGDQAAKPLPVEAEDIHPEDNHAEDYQEAHLSQYFFIHPHSGDIQEDDVQAHAIQAQDDHQQGDQAEGDQAAKPLPVEAEDIHPEDNQAEDYQV
ncbi:hypothetical protein CARUB_v10012217mg [Capsella rubella]|uniref:DUF1985 domain-containing protein n=1 Tax=Capsella rubella TaxID=81985 RepID=R0GNY8_9BRAS|nr:hypothetical protein CARUB_v10012217mg [Capsella rubella]